MININTRQEFIHFLDEFLKEYKTNPDTWENHTIKDFLEAMGRYAGDIQGYYDNTHQNIDANTPSWKVFADILKGASIYE